MRKRTQAVSEPAGAGALTADRALQPLPSSLQCASAGHLRFPPSAPSPPTPPPRPPFPFTKPAPGRAHRCEEAGGRTQEAPSPLPEDHVPAQPGCGPASRPLPTRLPGSTPGESGGEAGGRRGGGERPSSKPVRGAERALGSAQAQRHPPPLPTCALQRVDRLGVAGAGGRRCRACRARTSVLPGLRAVRRGQGQAAGRVCVAPDSPRLPVPRGDLKGRGREIRSPAAAPSRSSPAQTRPAGRPQQPARLALGERSWQEGRPVCTWFGPLRPGWQDGHAPSRDGASRTPSGTEVPERSARLPCSETIPWGVPWERRDSGEA